MTPSDLFRVFFGLFCWLFVWILALWRGRWPERTAAVGTLALGALSFFVHSPLKAGQFDTQGFLTDLALFALFLFLALRSHRIWTICAAGFQVLAVLTHAAFLIWRSASPWAYMSVSVLATWLVLISFYAGLFENEYRRRLELKTAREILPAAEATA